MGNWPKQEKALYRYRLEPDGSISCTRITSYRVVEGRYGRREYRFPIGSVCSVMENNIGLVKHGHITMFEDDIEKAAKLFRENLEEKYAAALKASAECKDLLEKMEGRSNEGN